MPSKVIDCTSNTYSFLSITLAINGAQLTPYLKSIEYGDKREQKAVFGGQATPVGVTPGTYTATCGFEFLTREAFDEFTAKNPYWMDMTTNVNVSYAETGKKTVSDTVKQVRIVGESVSASGTDAVGVKMETLVLGKIAWNGKEATAG